MNSIISNLIYIYKIPIKSSGERRTHSEEQETTVVDTQKKVNIFIILF